MHASPGRRRREPFTYKRIDFLRRQLNSQIILFGPWIRRRAVAFLSDAAKSGSLQALEVLAGALAQPKDPQLVQDVRKYLLRLEDQKAVNSLWAIWAKNRQLELLDLLRQINQIADNPLQIKVLSCLVLGRSQLLLEAHTVEPLVYYCHDPDPDLRRKSMDCLANLKSPASIDHFCSHWAVSRDEDMAQILVQSHYIARKPFQIHLLSVLKNGQVDLLRKIGAEGVSDLLAACDDPDPVIARRAIDCLTGLQDPGAQDKLCCLFNETGSSHAREAALSSGYLPKESSQKALFYFLTEQWEKYLSFDFDQAYLRTIFQVSSRELRQRIASTLQANGRTDLLVIMTGPTIQTHAADYSESEVALLVEMLSSKKEWEKLWQLVFEFSFSWSVKLVSILSQVGWSPTSGDDGIILKSLITLIADDFPDDVRPDDTEFPPMVKKARIKTLGRVNHVAFSPIEPFIALGIGEKKVVLWDYQKAVLINVIRGFNHSVGRVTYTPDNALICGERASQPEPCRLMLWKAGELVEIGSHEAGITSIECVGATRLLSTGRDGRIVLWDIPSRTRVSEMKYEFWARSASVSPSNQYAAIVHHIPTLISLPDLNLVTPLEDLQSRNGHYFEGVESCAAFLSTDENLVIGKHDGQVIVYTKNKQAYLPEQTPVALHAGKVQAIDFLSKYSVLISAGAEGKI